MQALLFIAQDTRISFGFSIFNKKKTLSTMVVIWKFKHVLAPLLASLPF